MKKHLYTLIGIVSLAAVSSCVGLRKTQTYPPVAISLADGYMQQRDGKVAVDMEIAVPEKYKSLHTGIKVYPVIEGATSQQSLAPCIIEGPFHETFNARMEQFEAENADTIAERMRYQKTPIACHRAVDYAPWMDGAQLYADLYANAYTEEIPLGRILIASGLLDLRPFIAANPLERYYYYGVAPSRSVVYGGSGDGSSTLVTFPLASDRMSANSDDRGLRDYLTAMANDPEVADYRVDVLISNSPEGSVGYNQKLGEKRRAAIDAYLDKIGVPAEKRNYQMTVEDWTGLSSQLPTLELEDQAAIEELIAEVSDLDEREHRIRDEHYADWQQIRRAIYPKLRKGDVSVTTTYKGASNSMRAHSLNQIPQAADQGRIDSFGPATESAAEVEALHSSMLDAVKNGDYQAAARYADAIPNDRSSEIVRSNKAIVYLKVGRYDDAQTLLERAQSVPVASYNLGLVYLLQGKYTLADELLDPYADINSAVAKLYLGKNREAIAILSLIKQTAHRDYLLAIAYARVGEQDQALDHLREAVGVDQSLAQRAQNEPDFASWKDSTEFQNIVK